MLQGVIQRSHSLPAHALGLAVEGTSRLRFCLRRTGGSFRTALTLAAAATASACRERRPLRSVSTVVTQPGATNDTLAFLPAALHCVARTRREQGSSPWRYPKAGVVMVDLVPLAASQRASIGRLDRERAGRLVGALDACNACFGRGSVVLAQPGLERQRRAWATNDAATAAHSDHHPGLHPPPSSAPKVTFSIIGSA